MARPKLDSTVINDDEAVGDAIDQFLLGDADLRRLSKKIREAQEALRLAASKSVFLKYLRTEAASNNRNGMALEYVARWAFYEGHRAARRERRR